MRGKNQAEADSGTMPRRTKGSTNLAVVEARRKSAARAGRGAVEGGDDRLQALEQAQGDVAAEIPDRLV
jgi:hypothetical protein